MPALGHRAAEAFALSQLSARQGRSAPWVAAWVAAVLVAGLTTVVVRGDEGEVSRAVAGTAGTTTTTTAVAVPASTAPTGASPARPPEIFGPVAPPSSRTSIIALANRPAVEVYPSPAAGPQRTLDNPQPSGAPLVFLVRQQQDGWVKVLLPVRPNGSQGWVRQADVTLTEIDFAVVVERRAHRVTVFKAGQVVMQEPAGIGTSNTPTPGGLYYLKELLKPPNPNSVYGAYAYGLSGFSNVLTSFQGGEGVIGLHGTNDPSGLGKDVSAGCIRISNPAITRLARMLPLGTPVEIRT